MRAITAIATLTGALMIPVVGFFQPVARADSLTTKELAYITQYGETVVCQSIAAHPTIPGVVGVVEGVVAQGFSAKEAVDITNASVATICPTFWPPLQRTGAAFRAADKGGQLV